MQLTCPHCGNASRDTLRMRCKRWIDHKLAYEQTDEGTILCLPGFNFGDLEETHFFCDACNRPFPVPDGVTVDIF